MCAQVAAVGWMSIEVKAACRLATKSICVVTSSRYAKSLKLPHRKKIPTMRDDRSGHRTGPLNPNQRSNSRGSVMDMIADPGNVWVRALMTLKTRRVKGWYMFNARFQVLPLMLCRSSERGGAFSSVVKIQRAFNPCALVFGGMKVHNDS
ncbi:hypothetical protein TNCV_4859011 [Trichonephila clavipes]|nr:hypothetical protein TNCV_4859011 [Trichonephila clavipes]